MTGCLYDSRWRDFRVLLKSYPGTQQRAASQGGQEWPLDLGSEGLLQSRACHSPARPWTSVVLKGWAAPRPAGSEPQAQAQHRVEQAPLGILVRRQLQTTVPSHCPCLDSLSSSGKWGENLFCRVVALDETMPRASAWHHTSSQRCLAVLLCWRAEGLGRPGT